MMAVGPSLRNRLARRTGQALLRIWPAVRPWIPPRVRRDGVLLDLSHPVLTESSRASIFFGMYEGSERRAVKRFVRGDLPCVELGASIGVLTCLLAKRSPRVVAAEPDACLLAVAQCNLDLNRLTHVTLVHAAIAYGANGGGVAFARGDETTTGRRVAKTDRGATIVPRLTLGDLVRRFALDRFCLACDIEGAEAEMLDSEDPDILRRCDTAIFELHATDHAGRRLSPAELADRVVARMGMRLAFTDGKVWVFRR
jgi:FkbM family methyltransferase